MESYINIDKNMIVNTTIGDAEVAWYDVRRAPFSLHGLYDPENMPIFCRVPFDVAEATSKGVAALSKESAGGRVRFSTNSPYIAVRAKYRVVGRSSHVTLVSTTGFDLYVDGEYGSRYVKEFRMPYDMVDSYEQIVYLDGDAMRSYTVNFPIHAVVESLEIGLKPDAEIGAARPYRDIAPVLFYGSSIVHGTAASRPGTIYPSIISRELNIDFRNIGFSGMAKGEPALAKWMASLPMSVFVCDYDHNAPTVEHLEKTHEALFMTVREKHPDIPIVMLSRPHDLNTDGLIKRYEVVKRTYEAARARGDQNVYLICGYELFEGMNDDLTVDAIHPNDIGFLRMANAVAEVLEKAFKK
jgi:hypothetical protein